TATYQVGSGNNTMSFLEDRNGYLFEMPLTWYAEKKLWDMSPGYRDNNWRFDRPINSTCLNCHTGPSRRTPQTENHYENVRFGIDCENCHGPGSDHVSMALQSPASKATFEQTIVHPADLGRETQMDICQRCHLEGIRVWNDGIAADEVEVGKRLSAHLGVFVSSDAHASESEFGIAAQADRLRKSACYQKSASMTCTTCHDPHQSAAHTSPNDFNAKCTTCHAGMPGSKHDPGTLPSAVNSASKLLAAGVSAAPLCTAPSARESDLQDCIRCHMKSGATSDIPHVRFTDHYIRRDLSDKPAAQRAVASARPFLLPVIHSENPAEKMLQHGLAYFEYHQTGGAITAHLDSTVFYLEAAQSRGASRNDGEDDYIKGSAFYLLGKMELAEPALRRAIAKNDSHARAYYVLGKLLIQSNRPAEAASIFARGEQARPQFLENTVGRGQAMLANMQFQEAITAFGQVLAADSLSHEQAYYFLGQVWHNAGNLTLARASYQRALNLNPGSTLALLNTGSTYVLEENWQEAVTVFDRILQRNPGYVPALFNKSVCLASLGRKREAQELVKKILALEVENEKAKILWRDLQKL
ncbi:MAG: tetratricopeptide repeat protein, partial [bacterium]